MKEKIKSLLCRVMQFRIKFTITIPVKRLLFALLVAAVIFGAVLGARAFLKSDVPLLFRDFAIAVIAHIKAGDPIPFEADYMEASLYPGNATWGIQTNSLYLLDWAKKIVPYYAYEDVTGEGYYPRLLVWMPLEDESSFHILGQAACTYEAVRLNDRILLDERWNDERMMLSTLVHELIHIQLGNYCSGSGQEREAHTQAATLEVLAGMCNYGEDLACVTFWKEVEGFARDALHAKLGDANLDWAYKIVSDVLWRDADKERATRKAMRYWQGDQETLIRIITDYGLYPWEKYILPGVIGGRLDTGRSIPTFCYSCSPDEPYMRYTVLGMPFDDTFDLLGIWRLLFFIQ